MKIIKGDLVQVISGKDKGKQGEVIKALPAKSKIVVKGVNYVVRHKKETGQKDKPGGRIKTESPIHVSNVMLVCPEKGLPTRVGYEVDKKTNKKFRIGKKTGHQLK